MSFMFQPSVYKSIDGKYFAEPDENRTDYYWITVHFGEDSDHRGLRDSEVMKIVKNKIAQGQFTVDRCARHGKGYNCLSIPIKRDPDTPLPKSNTRDPTHPDLLLAENLADYWKDQILARKVTLDQKVIFSGIRFGFPRLEEMVDVGVVLMDPWRIL